MISTARSWTTSRRDLLLPMAHMVRVPQSQFLNNGCHNSSQIGTCDTVIRRMLTLGHVDCVLPWFPSMSARAASGRMCSDLEDLPDFAAVTACAVLSCARNILQTPLRGKGCGHMSSHQNSEMKVNATSFKPLWRPQTSSWQGPALFILQTKYFANNCNVQVLCASLQSSSRCARMCLPNHGKYWQIAKVDLLEHCETFGRIWTVGCPSEAALAWSCMVYSHVLCSVWAQSRHHSSR